MSKITISNVLYAISIVLVIIYMILKSQDKTISEIYFVALGTFAIGFVLRILSRRDRPSS